MEELIIYTSQKINLQINLNLNTLNNEKTKINSLISNDIYAKRSIYVQQ